MRLLWVDAGCGASGDMLLGALTHLGALEPPAVIDALGVAATATVSATSRAGLAATYVEIQAQDDQPHRTWPAVRALVEAADLPEAVRARALATFARLATAEGAVHGIDPEQVHFHEVGAVDSLVDVVGVCAGLHALAAAAIHATPVALGGGTVRAAHGVLPVPGPAVLRLLADAAVPAYGGPVEVELCTPTGAALLAEHVTAWGAMPAMVTDRVGVGAGGRDLPDRPNVLRLIVGESASPESASLESASGESASWESASSESASAAEASTAEAAGGWSRTSALVIETNVDDLDPRLWPGVLARLLAAGAADAWLTPILMKKGRPAHTLSVLAPPGHAAALREVVFAETTALGLRERPVDKIALDRRVVRVEVDGRAIAVKLGLRAGVVVNAQPEWEDVAAAAAALGRPAKAVLAAAVAAAHAAGQAAGHATS